mmetsp:Transcript_74092/g.66676  ORF Transcript_74092/g.66676 Transcript_74092/m.66676 type:complete len:84 (+) Transcript_74092:21-272(+)
MSSQYTWFDRWTTANNYVNAMHNLPPTYTTINKQVVADPIISPVQVQWKINAVNDAAQKLQDIKNADDMAKLKKFNTQWTTLS